MHVEEICCNSAGYMVCVISSLALCLNHNANLVCIRLTHPLSVMSAYYVHLFNVFSSLFLTFLQSRATLHLPNFPSFSQNATKEV